MRCGIIIFCVMRLLSYKIIRVSMYIALYWGRVVHFLGRMSGFSCSHLNFIVLTIHIFKGPIFCYYRALFTTPLNKSNDDEAAGDSGIVIKGIRSPIMEQIINYAYLRECEIDEENVRELFTCADYCGIMGLVQRCIDFLTKILGPKNCISVMLFGK